MGENIRTLGSKKARKAQATREKRSKAKIPCGIVELKLIKLRIHKEARKTRKKRVAQKLATFAESWV